MLVTGLGPVGLATMMLARALGAPKIVGTDIEPSRVALAGELGLADALVQAGRDGPADLAGVLGAEGAEVTLDTTGSAAGRPDRAGGDPPPRPLRLRRRGRHRRLPAQPRPDPPAAHAARLVGHEPAAHGGSGREPWCAWKLHPDRIVTHRFALDEVAQAYRTMDEGRCGKVVVQTE